MKKIIVTGLVAFVSLLLILISCSGGNIGSGVLAPPGDVQPIQKTDDNLVVDPNIGIGKFKKVTVPLSLDASMADLGYSIYNSKCRNCHTLTNEKLLGAGWEGITSRHSAEWIMNFITNTDEMLNKDSTAKKILAIYTFKMPNQNLTDEEARAVYEFQRKNDGLK